MISNVDLEFDHFLKNDFSEYEEGTWVAIYKNNVISSGKILKKVIDTVNKKSIPVSKVLITKVRKTARYL
jgi:hypothetical protein